VVYYLYIDESGQFDEGLQEMSFGAEKTPPLVGGVCSKLSPPDWEELFRKTVVDFNKRPRCEFSYPNHFHCNELRSKKIPVPPYTTRQDIIAFTKEVFRAVDQHSCFLFRSRNPRRRFEYSPQATYVTNLVAAVRASLSRLAVEDMVPEHICVEVAQRTIAETVESRDGSAYMDSLLVFVREQVQLGRGPGVELARRLVQEKALALVRGVATQSPGLMAADFACAFLRRSSGGSETIESTSPDDILFGDYGRFYEGEAQRLLNAQQYAAAAEYERLFLTTASPDFGRVKRVLQQETDLAVVERETTAILGNARYLIGRRVMERGSLASARELLMMLLDVSEHFLSGAPPIVSRRVWADVAVLACVELVACHSHTGAVESQQEAEEKLEELVKTHGSLLPRSFSAREELLLEARVRGLNVLFNDYRFGEIIDIFGEALDEREARIPNGETDEALGKMLGSMGQACAFQARTEPSWSEYARDYVVRSISHFTPGTRFHSMSVNYLAALSWQCGYLDQACTDLHLNPNLPAFDTATDVFAELESLADDGQVGAFDLVNFLRIAAVHAKTAGAPERSVLMHLINKRCTDISSEHPNEQVCKWLGMLLLHAEMFDTAVSVLRTGYAICQSNDFTMRTIGLSVVGLAALTCGMAGNSNAYSAALQDFRELGEELVAQSQPFADYLESFGGLEGLVAAVKKRNLEGAWEIARFLPFSYA
jgi:hypothetical protein